MKKSTILFAVLATAIAGNAQQPVSKQLNDLPERNVQTPTRELEEGFEVITTPPAGEKILYADNAHGYKYSGGLYKAQGLTPTNVVWCENGDVYIQNIVSQYGTSNYVKGTVVDNKVVVELPQAYYDSQYYGTFYVNLMEAGENTYLIVGENNRVTYTIDEDRNLTLDLPSNGDYILGMTYDNEVASESSWAFYGDWKQKITRFTDEPTTLPAGVTPEKWEMVCDGNGRYITVAFDGNDVYLGSLYDKLPNAYVKGLYDEKLGTITFDMPQYLGTDPQWDCFDYFVVGIPVFGGGQITGYNLSKSIVFEYNAEEKYMKERDGKFMFINDGYDRVYYIEAFNSPLIRYPNQALELANPANPVFKVYEPYRESKRCGYTIWDIPNVNVNGAVLNTSRMSYIMYVDGEPFTFYTDEYKGFPEDMTEIPWDFNEYQLYDLYHEGARHTIYFYFRDAESIGMESLYEGSDGKLYRSEIVTYDVATGKISYSGIGEIEAGELSVEFYDLAGRKVANPDNGLFIRCARLANGSTLTSKVMIRK